ncbi:MAG TPA: Mpo1-like protein [Rubrivivax sp.]
MATPFRSALDLLAQYAEYHRDRRNIQTHFIGVPMIVFGIGVLLARPVVGLAGWAFTPAWLVFALVALWYLTRGHLAVGLASTVMVGVLLWLAQQVAGGSTAAWLAWGLGFFVLGWVIQFVGHYYEGRKPAFVDDLVGLLVAPMFVALELLAPLAPFKGLMSEIERRAGPTHLRDLAHPAL